MAAPLLSLPQRRLNQCDYATATVSTWNPQSGLQPATLGQVKDAVVSGGTEKKYGSLSEKILAASKFAEENDILKHIKFVCANGEISVQFSKLTLSSDHQRAQELVDQLNGALEGKTRQISKENETEIRKILGTTRAKS